MGVFMSRDPFYIFSPPKVSLQRLKLETSNLVCMLIKTSPAYGRQTVPKGAWSLLRYLLTFGK